LVVQTYLCLWLPNSKINRGTKKTNLTTDNGLMLANEKSLTGSIITNPL